MRRRFTLAEFAAAALMAAGSAHAQGVPVGTRAAFSGPTIDWGAVGPSGTSVSNPFATGAGSGTVTVGTDASSFLRLDAGSGWSGGFTTGDHLLFNPGGTNMTFAFSSPIFGFGTQTWYNYGPGGTLTFTEFIGATQTGSFTYATGGGGAANANQATFFGILDPSGFDRVVIQGVSNSGNPREFAINDVSLEEVSITPVTVPEPASLLLFGTGVTSLAGVIRRRRNR